MGIEKERELFKEEVSELDSFDLNDFTLNPFDWDEENQKFYFNPTQLMWEVWQAAKAQAVSEGFVLVPKEPTCEMIEAGMGNFDFPLDNGRFSNHDLIFAYRAMIEAQE